MKAAATRAGNALLRTLMDGLGEDVTEASAGRSCLVLAPHPDDEVLGCGATILRKRRAGRPVHVAFASDGRHSHASARVAADELARRREAEAREAARRLGVPETELTFFRIEDGRVAEHAPELREGIARLLSERGFDEVLVPSAIDGHVDHRALHQVAGELAAGDRLPRALEYPVWFWTLRRGAEWLARSARLALGARGTARPRLVRTDGLLEAKRSALDAYASQTTAPADDPDWATFPPEFLAHFFGPHEVFFDAVFEPGLRPR